MCSNQIRKIWHENLGKFCYGAFVMQRKLIFWSNLAWGGTSLGTVASLNKNSKMITQQTNLRAHNEVNKYCREPRLAGLSTCNSSESQSRNCALPPDIEVTSASTTFFFYEESTGPHLRVIAPPGWRIYLWRHTVAVRVRCVCGLQL